jgi:hypothetical protein
VTKLHKADADGNCIMRKPHNLYFHYDNQMKKKDRIGGACSSPDSMTNAYKILIGRN